MGMGLVCVLLGIFKGSITASRVTFHQKHISPAPRKKNPLGKKKRKTNPLGLQPDDDGIESSLMLERKEQSMISHMLNQTARMLNKTVPRLPTAADPALRYVKKKFKSYQDFAVHKKEVDGEADFFKAEKLFDAAPPSIAPSPGPTRSPTTPVPTTAPPSPPPNFGIFTPSPTYLAGIGAKAFLVAEDEMDNEKAEIRRRKKQATHLEKLGAKAFNFAEHFMDSPVPSISLPTPTLHVAQAPKTARQRFAAQEAYLHPRQVPESISKGSCFDQCCEMALKKLNKKPAKHHNQIVDALKQHGANILLLAQADRSVGGGFFNRVDELATECRVPFQGQRVAGSESYSQQTSFAYLTTLITGCIKSSTLFKTLIDHPLGSQHRVSEQDMLDGPKCALLIGAKESVKACDSVAMEMCAKSCFERTQERLRLSKLNALSANVCSKEAVDYVETFQFVLSLDLLTLLRNACTCHKGCKKAGKKGAGVLRLQAEKRPSRSEVAKQLWARQEAGMLHKQKKKRP